MDIFLTVVCVLVAFTVGLVAGGGLARGVVEDLRDLLAHLLEYPNDEDVRAIVRSALYQKK